MYFDSPMSVLQYVFQDAKLTEANQPRSKDSLRTVLVQIAHHHSKDNPSLPNGYPQKLNSKGSKFGDAVINHNGDKGYVIGHTRCC